MPIDLNIYGGSRPAQAADPMQTLAQVSAMQNMQMQRLEAQQRIGINQAAEQRLSQSAALEDQKRQEALDLQGKLRQAFQNSTTPEGEIDIPKVGQWLIQNNAGDAWPAVQEKLVQAQKAMSDLRESGGKNEVAARDAMGGIAAGVKLLPKEQQIAGVQNGLSWLQGFGVLSPQQTTGIINQIRDAPENLDTILDVAIKQSPGQQKLINEAPRPIAVGAESGLYDPISGKWIRQPTAKAPDLGSFEDFVGRYATEKGIAPKDITTKDIDMLREKYRLNQQIPVNIQLTQKEMSQFDQLPYQIKNTFGMATSRLNPKLRQEAMQDINRAMAEGRTNDVNQRIMRAAIDSESTADRAVIQGRADIKASMVSIADALKKVPQGLMGATYEDTLRALGQTGNPEMVRIKAQIESSLANYRRAMTGAAFGADEAADYAKRFPNYKNQPPVNLGLMQGFLDDVNVRDRSYWESKLGPEGAKLVGAVNPVNVLRRPGIPAAPATGGTSSAFDNAFPK